jgi:hypothetical protein
MTSEINIAHARLGFTTIKYIVICLFEPQPGVGDILFLKSIEEVEMCLLTDHFTTSFHAFASVVKRRMPEEIKNR